MKLFITTLLLLLMSPLFAEMATPIDEPAWVRFNTPPTENARQAVRLGYSLFKTRLNTPNMTHTDRQIALLITTGFQPFFEKLNRLENASQDEVSRLSSQYSDEFADLISRLSKLFIANQNHYLTPWIIDDNQALQETLLIVQQAIKQGSF